MAHDNEAPAIVLPLQVVTRSDLGRMLREAEAIEDFLHQAAIRKAGTALQLPRTTQSLQEFLTANNLNLLQPADRQFVISELQKVYGQGPVLHMSFSVDPSTLFLQKLISWLRQQIHPQIILQIGLQPNQGAGCIVRTTNKYFDLSLRQRFTDKRDLLVSMLAQTANPPEISEAKA